MGYNQHAIFQNDPAVNAIGIDVGTGATALDDILTFAPAVPVIIVRWGFVCTVTTTGSPAFPTFAMDKRINAGADAGRVADWGGTITPTAALVAGTVAQHTLIAGEGPSLPAADSPDGFNYPPEWLIRPGEEVIVELVIKAATAGDGWPFIEYYPYSGNTGYFTTGDGGVVTEFAA